MERSKDLPHKLTSVAMAGCHDNIDKRLRKKEIHVLGFSRFMASRAFVSDVQVLLGVAAGAGDRGAGAWLQQEKSVDGLRPANAVLCSWDATHAAFRDGDSPPALCAW